MKNKFLTICIILAVILSVMSFTAILMPRNATSDEPTETAEAAETSPEETLPESNSFTVGDWTYRYFEGWTWRTFLKFEGGNDFHTQGANGEYIGYRGDYLVFEYDQETPIGLDEVIEPGDYIQKCFD